MNDFFKRLSWRLTGGIVTIALGAFAAAQSQRAGIVDETPLPSMEAPAWADSLPIPIQTGPEQARRDSSSQQSSATDSSGPSVMPAAFAADMSMPATTADSLSSPPNQPGDTFVSPVNHEAPVGQESPMGDAEQPIQQSEAQPPQLRAMSMPLPGASMPAASSGSADTSGPSMFMPAMPMPGESNEPDANTGEVESHDHAALGPAPMSEIQFDQGPDVALQPSTDPSMNNSLRSGPAPGYEAQAQLEMPLPSLPQPQSAANQAAPYPDSPHQNPQNPPHQNSPHDDGNYQAVNQQANEANPPYAEPSYAEPSYAEPLRYPNEPASGNNMNPPARLAGHQTTGLPANLGPSDAANQIGPGTPNDDSAQYGNSNGDSIAVSIPGDRHLEGVQTPSIVIHKRAPAEVKVGRPATFVVQVRNVGSAEALGVQVHDRIPAGMELIEATPTPIRTGDLLTWDLGAMPIGDERSITMQLVAREEGELGSVARVTFEAAASVRTRSTRPELKIIQRAPQKVLIGQQLEIELEISNIGTGEATGVILQADVPQGLDHPRGRQLDNALGSLRPGETRREILRLRAVQPGTIRNVVHLVAEDAQEVTDSVDVEVVSPSLNVQLAGPSRRFLERQATYVVNIENNGSAPATNVEVIAYLDRGFTFVSTENNGHYDSNRHAVLWSIVNLPPGDAGSVPLTLLPVEEGDQAIRLEAVADLETRAQSESTVSVQSQAELSFSIADTADPIELGSETTYEIRVKNSGSRNDTNVQVRMIVPPGIDLLQSDAEVQTDGRGGLTFAPHQNLAAGGEMVYRVRVKGTQPNTHIIKAIVTSDQARVPVTKEESTMVYEDR